MGSRGSPIPQQSRPVGRAPTNHGGLQVHKHGSGHVLAGPSLTEERVERVVPTADGFVTGHLTIGLNSMFKAVQLPAGIADLNPGLAHVDGYAFPLRKQSTESEPSPAMPLPRPLSPQVPRSPGPQL